MSKNSVITVLGHPITVSLVGEDQFVSLTDMAAPNGGNDKIQQWIRNKDTVEFLGVWEQLYNPNFNSVEFHRIMYEAGVARFTLSISQWISRTGAIGLQSKAGRYGETKAHKDLAFEFGTYLSPVFKLAFIKEFQRLQEQEAKQSGGQWDFRRFAAKVNLKLQTDAVKEVLIPFTSLPVEKQGILYAEASDIIYLAMFGYTSKEWREKNPELAKGGKNIRDYATSHQLIILANLENIDAIMLKAGITDKLTRIKELRKQAINQIKILRSSTELQHELVESPNNKLIHITDKKKDEGTASFDQQLKGLLSVPPPKRDK